MTERAYYWTRKGKRGEGFRPVAARKGKRMEMVRAKFEGEIGLSEQRIIDDLSSAIMAHLVAAITHVGATLGKAKISASVEFGWDEKEEGFWYSPPVPTVTLTEPKTKEAARITTEGGAVQLFLNLSE